MPIFLNDADDAFPPAGVADEHGIVAIGGDLTPARLIMAYQLGIFPWPHEGLPLLWFSPDPRFVLVPSEIIINQTLRKVLRRTSLIVKADQNFLAVITKCAKANRHDQNGTWITDGMIKSYYELFKLGLAHSIEVYDEENLVGGLYGISMGSIFFGESMFFERSDASKIGFVTLVAHLLEWNFSLIDCQAHTHHLEKFGAHALPRESFLAQIAKNQQVPTKLGPWQFYLSPREALLRINSI